MRLFVSLRPPDEVLAHLVETTTALQATDPRVRWLPPERLHVTVAFLGEVDPRRLPGLSARLGRAATRSAPLRLQLYGAGRLGRVLSCRLRGDVAGLTLLAEACAAAARRAGLDLQTRAFTAHLTVARARSAAVRPDLRPLIERLADYEGPPWVAETTELMRSHLGSAPHYETLHQWTLGPSPSGATARV